jgi:putative transcriptional regulator
MAKSAFDKIAAGLNDAIAIAKGEADLATYHVHVPDTVDVRAVRKSLKLTQAEFAARFGFSLGTVRDWEQARTAPKASDRVLLKVIEREPKAVMAALSA